MLFGIGIVLLVSAFILSWKFLFGTKVRIPIAPGHKFFYGHVHHFAGLTFETRYIIDEVLIKLTDPKTSGPLPHIKIFSLSEISLSTVKAVEPLLKSNININKSHLYNDFLKWFNDSVLVLPHQQWQIRRKQLTPAFHFAIMEDFESTMKEHSYLLIEAVQQNPNKLIIEHILDVTLHTIIETSFGVTMNTLADSGPYLTAINNVLRGIQSKPMNNILMYCKWYYYNLTSWGKQEIKAINHLNEMLMKIVEERKKDLAEGRTRLHNGKKSFLAHMVELQATEGVLTDEQILGESSTILVAGHGTTTSTVGWTLYFLCRHPEVQERLYQEIKEHLKGRPFSELEVGSLAYLNMVVKESLRLQPPVTLTGRVLTEPMTIDGWMLPAGTNVDINIYWIHRDPEFWPDPEKFDPMRFSTENSKGRNPYAFIPFSAGPRNCIGQRFGSLESRILVAAMVYNFKMSTDQELGKDLRRDYLHDITATPGPNFKIQYERRC